MNFTLRKMQDYTLIELTGKIDEGIVISAGSFVRDLNIDYPETVILDIDGLEDEREMFYHVALLNTFKKVVEQSGGILKIRANRLPIIKYLNITGLKKIFLFDERLVPLCAEV